MYLIYKCTYNLILNLYFILINLILVKSVNSNGRPFSHFYKMNEYETKIEFLADEIRNSIFTDVKKYFEFRKLTPVRLSQLF